MVDAKLKTAVDIDDVVLTETLFCLLSDDDVLFALAQNSCFVCTVCHSDFALLCFALLCFALLCSSYSSFSKCD